LKCAEKYPGLGADYDACIAGCPHSAYIAFFEFLLILSPPPQVHGGVPWAGELQDAIDWATELRQLRDTSNNPLEVLPQARAFLDSDWQNPAVRGRFIEPFYLSFSHEVITSRDTDDLVYSQAFATILAAGATGRVTLPARVAILASAKLIASDEARFATVDALVDALDAHEAVQMLLEDDSERAVEALLSKSLSGGRASYEPESPRGGLNFKEKD